MHTSAISSAALTSTDTDALLKLIESIRAEKAVGVSNADTVSKITTSADASENAAPAAVKSEINLEDVAGAETLPALGRYVNIWA